MGRIHHPVWRKKGGRCTAFATRHEEHLSQMEKDTLLYYRAIFVFCLGLQTGSVHRAQSLFFGGILFALFLPSFYHWTFFLTCFWLAPAVFLTLYSPTCFTLRADEITVMKKESQSSGRSATSTGCVDGGCGEEDNPYWI